MNKKEILLYLQKHGTKKNVETMKRFGINLPKAFGVNAPTIRTLAKQVGTNHPLALSLWKSEYHEARVLATLVADPVEVTEDLMEDWVNDFDSWAVCDACCGELFCYTSFAITKAHEWSRSNKEYVKRAGFVIMAALSVHCKELDNKTFLSFFPVIEREAGDNRNFVKKGVSWALRQIGKRNSFLHGKAFSFAKKLSKNINLTTRWIGSDAVKDLTSDAVTGRLRRMKNAGL